MWKIKKIGNNEIWESDICFLNITKSDKKCNVFIDYRGHNVAFTLGMWGIDDELVERNIDYKLKGEKNNIKSLYYELNENDLRLFADIVYFFIKENNIDTALDDADKY